MPADEPQQTGEGDHRPLPSVEMPLLRPDIRANRNRQLISGGVGLVATALLVAVAFFVLTREPSVEEPESLVVPGAPEGWQAENQPPEEEGAEVAPAQAAAPNEPSAEGPVTPGAISRTEANFGEARGFRDALINAGLARDEYVSLEQALDGVMDFRRCRPTDRMVMERDMDGTLVRWEYHSNPTDFVQMTRNEMGEMVGERVEVPVETTRVTKGGRVEGSLGAALAGAGLGRSLVGAFVEIFDSKVNFSTQARSGDTFRIIVDEERIDDEFLRYGTIHALEYNGQRTGTVRAFYHESRDGRGDYYDEEGRSVHGGWLRPPCPYDRISSRFNPRRMHPILRRIVPHNGVDYAASRGTPVWAAADGTITWAGPKGPNGNLVAIRHADGFESFYAHLHAINRGIRRGVEVRQRQPIGTVGSTGRSTGPHLHFGLKRHGRFVDPLDAINGPGRLLPAGQLGPYRRRIRRLTTELSSIETGSPAPLPEPAVEAASAPAEGPMD